METREQIDEEVLALKGRLDAAEARHQKDQETIERQAMLINYLEPANDALSARVAELIVELTRLRITTVRADAA